MLTFFLAKFFAFDQRLT